MYAILNEYRSAITKPKTSRALQRKKERKKYFQKMCFNTIVSCGRRAFMVVVRPKKGRAYRLKPQNVGGSGRDMVTRRNAKHEVRSIVSSNNSVEKEIS
jgi:hypothetical protein